jgi:hypothetical protein
MDISEWPSTSGGRPCHAAEVPTRLALDAAHCGHSRWGFQVSADEEAFRLFKLALMHPEYVSDTIHDSAALQNARRVRRFYCMPPGEVAALFLRELWATSLQQAAVELRMTLDQLAQIPFHVVIGVPANWSPDVLFRLREAVSRAGIPDPRHPQSTAGFFSEPEAATLSLLKFPNPISILFP